jgi:hypothetical protein
MNCLEQAQNVSGLLDFIPFFIFMSGIHYSKMISDGSKREAAMSKNDGGPRC